MHTVFAMLLTSCHIASPGDSGTLLPDSRKIALDGAENFRDLGGYDTSDGRKVKWGVMFRSDKLSDLSKRDIASLEEMGIREVVDFRGLDEAADEADRLPESVEYSSYPIDIAGSDLREKVTQVIKGESDMDIPGYLISVNRQLATVYTPVYREWIQALARDEAKIPQVFHCTAGKDRAGFAAAILLRVLGVPKETVMADYLKTNEYSVRSVEKTIRMVKTLTLFRSDGEVIRPLLSADEAYLNAAFTAIDEEWGSFESYTAFGLELSSQDVENLRQKLLD